MLSGLLNICAHTLFTMLRVSGAGSFPNPLSPEEEQECLNRMFEGSTDARDKLIEHNLRLVAHIIKKYSTQNHDIDDLISIGTIGLIKAINTFDAAKGTKLATYTARCIENEILMFFRSQKRSQCEISLSEPIENDREGGSLALMDVISVDDDMAERLDEKNNASLLYKKIYGCLSPREIKVLSLRYGLFGAKRSLTQRETAQLCGISRSYVSRIEKAAMKKLKEAFE